MDKRGISPLIATVLLIGFAVALAAVVMTWGLDFVNRTADATDKQTKNTLTCASDLSFSISDVDPLAGSITIDNRGQVNIKSVIFRIYGGNEVKTVDSASGGLTAVGIDKFGVVKFEDLNGAILSDTLTNAIKVEAIATVQGEPGEDDIVCPQNIQEYTL